jgi:hypothetical protein
MNDGGSMHVCNVGQLQSDYTALHPRILQTSERRADYAVFFVKECASLMKRIKHDLNMEFVKRIN